MLLKMFCRFDFTHAATYMSLPPPIKAAKGANIIAADVRIMVTWNHLRFTPHTAASAAVQGSYRKTPFAIGRGRPGARRRTTPRTLTAVRLSASSLASGWESAMQKAPSAVLPALNVTAALFTVFGVKDKHFVLNFVFARATVTSMGDSFSGPLSCQACRVV